MSGNRPLALPQPLSLLKEDNNNTNFLVFPLPFVVVLEVFPVIAHSIFKVNPLIGPPLETLL